MQNNQRLGYFLVSMIFASGCTFYQLANATIYKWRDAHGVMQYADNMPTSNNAAVPRAEIVNALQKKDLCAEAPLQKKLIKTTLASSALTMTTYNANFFGNFSKNKTAPNVGNTGLAKAAAGGIVNDTKNIAVTKTYSAFGNASSSVFGFGRFFVQAIAQNNKPKVIPNVPPVVSPPAVINTPPKPLVSAAPVTTAPVTPLPVVNSPVVNTPVVTPSAVSPSVSPPVSPSDVKNPPIATPVTVQVGYMPTVNVTQNMLPEIGANTPYIGASSLGAAGDGTGQFRITCTASHMSNDDPLVYPNQQNAAHHHTFFGNTSTNYNTDPATISAVGNSTCKGGILNRSAYWVPSVIDTATNSPIKPLLAAWYYKTGYLVAKEKVVPPPKGLRMIAGNSKATASQREDINTNRAFFSCTPVSGAYIPETDHISNCAKGDTFVMHVVFPQCWDGVNLDSPDHKSHMAYAPNSGAGCPASHPVTLPQLSLNVRYLVTATAGTANWRLSSDNYAHNANNRGYSAHADWINGWDEATMKKVVKNCLNAGIDCGVGSLNDGTGLWVKATSEW